MILSLMSCEHKTLDIRHNRTALQVNATVATATKAVDQTWSVGDAIGVIATTSPLSDSYQNAKYTLDEEAATEYGHFSATADDIIYFSDDTEISFTAYAPYQDSDVTELPGSEGTVTVSDSDAENQVNSQEKIDFLFAGTQTADENSPTVDFEFDHQMTKIIVNIYAKEDAYKSTIAAGTYSLQGLVKGGTFKVTDGTCAASGTAADWEISSNWPTDATSSAAVTYVGIIFPQAPTQGDLVFSADDLGLTAELHVPNTTDDSIEGFVSGYAVTYDLTITEKSLVVGSGDSGNGSTGSTINDWNGLGGSGDYEVSLGD